MELSIKADGCVLMAFSINGVSAAESDFGEMQDLCHEMAEYCGCGDMQFVAVEATQEVLDKYHISAQEYEKICECLEQELSVGKCNRCC